MAGDHRTKENIRNTFISSCQLGTPDGSECEKKERVEQKKEGEKRRKR